MNWYIGVLKQYTVFTGRARRKEYWFFVLISMIVTLILSAIDAMMGTALLATIYSLAVLIPSLAVTARRLHDTDRSGWWMLIAFLPLIGGIILLVFLFLEGTPGPNRFGPSPKEVTV